MEGQIFSKVERARAYAQKADVIFFGGSYIRYGFSYQPFFNRKILPWMGYRNYMKRLLKYGLYGNFWGSEDYIGFSAYLRDHIQLNLKEIPTNEPLQRANYIKSKIVFIRKFLDLAQDIGVKVALISSPSVWRLNANGDYYQSLAKELLAEYPNTLFISQNDAPVIVRTRPMYDNIFVFARTHGPTKGIISKKKLSREVQYDHHTISGDKDGVYL